MQRRFSVVAILASAIFPGVLSFKITRLFAQNPDDASIILKQQASFFVPPSVASLRIAGFDYTDKTISVLFVEGKGQSAYAEVVTADTSGALQTRIALAPPPNRPTSLSIGTDSRIALAGRGGVLSIYSPSGSLEKSVSSDLLSDAKFINGTLVGLTRGGEAIAVWDTNGNLSIPPLSLLWPSVLVPAPASGAAAVFELSTATLHLYEISTGSLTQIQLKAPNLTGIHTADFAVPAIFAGAIGRDSGRIFTTLSGVGSMLGVLEFDRKGVLKAQYKCPVPTVEAGPGTGVQYDVPREIGSIGSSLITFSHRGRVIVYQLPNP